MSTNGMDAVGDDSWDGARELLCVRLDAAGDVLMTTPALRALRRRRPDRRITLLTSRTGAAIAELVPEVDAAIAHDAPWVKAGPSEASPAADRDLIERLADCGFDAAAIFTVYSQSPLPAALACHLAGIPRRLAHCRENPYRLLTDWVPEREPEQGVRHEVERQLDLVAAVGAGAGGDDALSLAVPASERAAALAALAAAGHDPGEPWVLAHPGATAESRRYPPELLAGALDGIARATGRRVVVAGGPGERELAHAAVAGLGGRAVDLAGTLSLAQLCGLIAAAPLLVCNNSAPAHVAAAVGTPAVVLYALTNPQHRPWRARAHVLSHDVPCRWCYRSFCPEGHHACLRGVTPDRVVAAALDLLASASPSASQPSSSVAS